MRHVRILGLCLAAMFAITAVGATGAFAKNTLPEWGGCEAQPSHEGKYGDAGCTVPVKKVYGKYTGGYEWYAGEQFAGGYGLGEYNFAGSIGPTTFETTNGKAIHCSGGELHQLQIRAPKSVGDIWTSFEGCESEGQECRSKFHAEGELTDKPEWVAGEGFKGELVYVAGKNTTTPTVGLTLTAFNPGEPLFTVVCEGALGTVEIGGAGGKKTEKSKGNTVISLISPVDEMTGEYTQTFTQTLGVQSPAKAEKGKEKALQMFETNGLEGNKWFQLGVATTFQDVAEEGGRLPVEIKAIP